MRKIPLLFILLIISGCKGKQANDNFPEFKLDFTTTPATSNPLGSKGCGEAGAIAAPPAVMNAVIDAVGTDVSMPATAEKVWKALKKNGSKKAAA